MQNSRKFIGDENEFIGDEFKFLGDEFKRVHIETSCTIILAQLVFK